MNVMRLRCDIYCIFGVADMGIVLFMISQVEWHMHFVIFYPSSCFAFVNILPPFGILMVFTGFVVLTSVYITLTLTSKLLLELIEVDRMCRKKLILKLTLLQYVLSVLSSSNTSYFIL